MLNTITYAPLNAMVAAELAGALPKKSPVKKAAAKKSVPKMLPSKAVSVKKAAPKKVAVVKEVKPKAPGKAATKKAPTKGRLYFGKAEYKELVAGLMDQGIDHADAVETLKVGLRQANGIPVSAQLLMSAGAGAPVAMSSSI